MVITVTKRDITYGSPNDPWHCPIARAVRRASGVKDCAVTPKFIRIRNRYIRDIPKQVSIFMHDFDKGKVVEPFSFSLK